MGEDDGDGGVGSGGRIVGRRRRERRGLGVEGRESDELDLSWLSAREGEETGALVRSQRDESCRRRISSPGRQSTRTPSDSPLKLSVVWYTPSLHTPIPPLPSTKMITRRRKTTTNRSLLATRPLTSSRNSSSATVVPSLSSQKRTLFGG